MKPNPLLGVVLEPLVRAGLLEDLGRAGDLTSEAVVPADTIAKAAFVAREVGVVAGLDMARIAFRLVDERVHFEVLIEDGERVKPGDVIARISGPARGILTGERVALNFVGRLSGIASATRVLVDAVSAYKARIVCTRKTIPGMRAIEKYAVRCGGGANHRFGLDDAILIKDNHLAIAGGVREALMRARSRAGHLVKIELEVDTLDQLAEALDVGVDAVLLDNMSNTQLARAVAMVAGRAITEASGRVTPETAPGIAKAGVDLISAGWLTHSAKVLDIGLDI